MKRLVLLILVFSFSVVYGFEIDDYPYKSKYEASLKNVTDEKFISNALDDRDLDLVYAALKKVGELKLTNLKPKVIALIGSANPQANLGKVMQSANYKHIFYVGLLVMGKIGSSEEDATFIASFLRDTKDDVIGNMCILKALGDLKGNPKALEFLHQYTLSFKRQEDSRVIRALVDALLSQNKRSSITYLLNLRKRVSQNDQVYINQAIRQLNKIGER